MGVAGVLTLVAACSAGAPSAIGPAADLEKIALPAGHPPASDRDGDGLFDNLSARLKRLAPTARVEVIVTLDDASPAAVERVRRQVGFGRVRRLPLIDAFAAPATRRQIEAVADLAGVHHVQEDVVMTTLNDSAQRSFGVTQAQLDLPSADGNNDGAASYSKDDIVAAVVDTGIDGNHIDLDGGKILAFRDFVGPVASPAAYDDNGHGSHVAGVIAGTGEGDNRYRGIAPGAALVGVKVLNHFGMGVMSNIVAGINWVVDNRAAYGIDVLNLSIGQATCELSGGDDAASAAVDAAHAAGLVVVVAAGNSGPDRCTLGTPAGAADALTVGAMADLGVTAGEGFGAVGPGFSLAYFSSRGPTEDGRIKPDIAAPGVAVNSVRAGTLDQYRVLSGTSMAAPFVAGVAALMLDVNASLTPAQIKHRLMATAVDWARGGTNATPGTSGPDTDYGAGRLDAYAALAAAGAPITTPPTPVPHLLFEGSVPGTGAVREYSLNVTNTEVPIAATMILPNAGGADLDLRLYDPNGDQVASAESPLRQDELGAMPAMAGTYSLRVESFSGAGEYLVDVSGASLAAGIPVLRHHLTSVADPPEWGDGDGVVEPGESFVISEQVRNAGDAAATAVVGALSTVDTGLLITDHVSAFGSVQAGEFASNAIPYRATLAESAPCGRALGLTLTLTTDQGDSAVPFRIATGHAAPAVEWAGVVPAQIVDFAATTSTLEVTAPGFVKDLDVRLADIEHTFDADLTIELISPAGTLVSLVHRRGLNGDGFHGTILDDEAPTKISAAAAPFTGSFRPEEPLSAFDGEQQQGTWTLRIVDHAAGDEGMLEAWGHAISKAVCDPPPVAHSAAVSTWEDTPVAIELEAEDLDSAELTYTVVNGPTHGTLSGTAPNLVYTPAADRAEPAAFTFRANDGKSDSNVATVSISVTPVNDAPVASDDSRSTPEDTPLSAAVPAADDPDGAAPLTYELQSTLGGLTFNSDGMYVYTPPANANGSVSFTYRASDGALWSNVATVTVHVTPVNDAPTAADSAFAMLEDSTLDASVPEASDVDSSTFTYELVAGLPGLTLSPTGDFTYEPPLNANGQVSFAYRANDGDLVSAPATVTIAITPVNDAPVAADVSVTTDEDVPLALALSASDVDGETPAIAYTQPEHGSFDGSTYTPDSNWHGADTFSYRAEDAGGAADSGTVTVTVRAVNDAPIALPDVFTVAHNAPFTVSAPGVLANDFDVETALLAASVVGSPANGALSLAADGSFAYTPNPGFAGADGFTYRASDGAAQSGLATVTLIVAQPPPPPPPPPDDHAPSDPTVESTSHRVGVVSFDRTIDVRWFGAADDRSGVDGFSFHWDNSATAVPDAVKDVEEGVSATTSPTLSNGDWYFHLRTVDNAGNWTATRHLGPFVIASRVVRRAGCVVPRLLGKTTAQARRLLSRRLCALGVVRRGYSSKVKAGRIVRQSRRPGTRLRRGAKIAVVVSRGRRAR